MGIVHGWHCDNTGYATAKQMLGSRGLGVCFYMAKSLR